MLRKILVIHQDGDGADPLRNSLREAGAEVVAAYGSSAGLTKARVEKPSAILLDLTLPTNQVIPLCRQLKVSKFTDHVPVIILASEATEDERISGFQAGADDFITQPFSYREVNLRIKNSLSRYAKKDLVPHPLEIGDLRLDHGRHELTIRNRLVRLTPMEFKLLARLMEKNGFVLQRETLLDIVWGLKSSCMTRTVDAHVKRLRIKLGAMARHLETVRGVGYRLNLDIASPKTNGKEAKTEDPRVEFHFDRNRQNSALRSRGIKKNADLVMA